MEIKDILKMNPESECKITYNGSATWLKCYYQLINDSNVNLNPNDLPKLDEKYIYDGGEHFKNENNDFVYDPNQEIKFEYELHIGFKEVISSKTFISQIQKKINELIESNEIDIDDELDEFWSIIGAFKTRGFIDGLTYGVECKDYIKLEYKEDNPYLWFNSYQIGEEDGEVLFEEI